MNAPDAYEVLPAPLRERVRQEDRRERRTSLVIAAVLVPLGLGFALYLVVYSFSRSGPFQMRGEESVPALIGLVLAALGAWSGWAALQPGRLLSALHRPGVEVVWIYLVDHSGNTGRQLRLTFASSDGSAVWLVVPPGEGASLLAALAPHYRRATLGYSEEAEMRFRADPAAMRAGA
jgi:hypothetical protein